MRVQVEAFVAARSAAVYAEQAGRGHATQLAALFRAQPRVGTEDALAAVTEALAGADAESPRSARLKALRAACAALVEDRATATFDDAMADAERTASVREPDGVVGLRAALAKLPQERMRARRSRWSAAIDAAQAPLIEMAARRLDAAMEAATRSAVAAYPNVRASLEGFDLLALADGARGLLKETRDAYADVLSWALRQLELAPYPGDASHHDLAHLLRTAAISLYPRGFLKIAIQRWCGEFGFDPEDGISWDLESRAHKSPQPFAGIVEAPGEVVVCARPEDGAPACAGLLGALGQALATNHVDPQAPFEDRWLGDGAIAGADALLFAGLAADTRWVKRYLGDVLPADAQRLFALRELAVLRRRAAQILFEIELPRLGGAATQAEQWREGQVAATLVEPPRAGWILDVEPQFAVARRLRAYGVAAGNARALVERFDVDWWRNPRAAEWWRGRWAKGSRQSVAGAPGVLAVGVGVARRLS